MNLSDYILKTREERTAHIDLSTPCDPRGSVPKSKTVEFHELIDDCPNWVEAKVSRNHLCEHGSTNGWCSNPLHYYIGTAQENAHDRFRDARERRAGVEGSDSLSREKAEQIVAMLVIHGLRRKVRELREILHLRKKLDSLTRLKQNRQTVLGLYGISL